MVLIPQYPGGNIGGGDASGELPEASADPILTGGPTREWWGTDPRTDPTVPEVLAVAGVWHITASGSSGSYTILDQNDDEVATISVGDDDTAILAAITAGGGGYDGYFDVVGDWSDFVLTEIDGGSVDGYAPFTMDDALLVGGTATIDVTTEPTPAVPEIVGLQRVLGSRVVFVDGTAVELENMSSTAGSPDWVPVISAQSSSATVTVEQNGNTDNAISVTYARSGYVGIVTAGGVLVATGGAGAITADLSARFTALGATPNDSACAGVWTGTINGAAAGGVVSLASGVATLKTATGAAFTTAITNDDQIDFTLTVIG